MEIPKRYKPNKFTHDRVFSNKLFLINVSGEATLEQIYNLFRKYGKINSIRAWNGWEYRCGKVVFENNVDVKLVQCELSGLPFLNEILLVAECKKKKQIHREYEIDTREGYSNEICVYGYRHYKRCCDEERLYRFIYNPVNFAEIQLMNGPTEEDEEKWDFRHYRNIIEPHIDLRMRNAWDIIFRYRGVNKEEYYKSIPSQEGKWFPRCESDDEF